MPPDLQGAVAVVTGASRDVGRGVATALAQSGATVYATGRKIEDGDLDESIHRAACDHTDDTAVEPVVRRAAQRARTLRPSAIQRVSAMRRIRQTTIAVCCLVPLLSCGGDDMTTAPELALTHTVTSAHYVFHMAPGDLVDTTWQERYYAWVVVQLEVQPNARLDYFKYRDRAHITQITGRATNGFAEPGTTRFHTIWPVDNHEGVHTLVIAHLGHPAALFNEGVAVAHQTDPLRGDLTPRWSGTAIHTIARTAEQTRRIPELTALLTSQGFFQFDSNLMYPVAGSFVRYLLDTYGLARFKTLLAGARFNDSASSTQARFLTAYGKTLAAAWDEWLAWLRQQS